MMDHYHIGVTSGKILMTVIECIILASVETKSFYIFHVFLRTDNVLDFRYFKFSLSKIAVPSQLNGMS